MKINNFKSSPKKLGNINNYIIKEDIGEGNFGKIKLAIYKPTGDIYAMKILNKETIKQKMKNVEFKENEIALRFHHINIVNVFELIESKENYYIVMELCQKGELFDYIVENKKLSDEEASIFFYQLINGVSYLHSKGVSHRDLKPENLLLTNDKVLKIIDFGLSHEYDGNNLLKTKCGSPSYAAPEIIKGKSYDGFKVDTWCCGIILYAMVCGYLPFEGETNKELFKSIVDCNPEYPDFLSNKCKKLLKQILVVDPEKRISIEDIKLNDFYLKGKDLCKLNYDIDLEELDIKSYINKSENNNNNNNNEKKDNNKNEKENLLKDLYDKTSDFETIFTKIDVFNKKSNNEENNNKENKSNNSDKNEKIKEYNNLKEKGKYNILFGKNDEVNSLNTINSQNKNQNNNMNSIATSFLHKNSVNNNIKKAKMISNIKKLVIKNDNNNDILQTLKNSRNYENNNIFKLNTIKNNEMNHLNIDFQSIYTNRIKKNKKEIKLLETNPNEYDKIKAKFINKFSKDKNHTPIITKINSKNNLKYNKKLILDINNSNNASHLNSNKGEINYFTDMNTKTKFELNNKNKSVSPKIMNRKIPPIKDADKIFNSNLYYNDINININNLNVNNINDNFLNLSKLKDMNLLQNSDKIKININNINNDENLGNYMKFKNNIFTKSDKKNNISIHRIQDKILKDNLILNNISERDNNISKKSLNLNRLILNSQKNKKKVGNSIDLSSFNDNRGILKKKIFKNLFYNTDTNSDKEHNRCNTINNHKKNIWYDNNNNSVKTPQNIVVKENLIKREKINNIFKGNNKYELNNERKKFKKGHKYQIALKEFLNLVQLNNDNSKVKSNPNNNSNNIINNNINNNNNKDYLPYL